MGTLKAKGESMPAFARKEIVQLDEVGTYHCTSRCVRGKYLCGYDRKTGEDNRHRRNWFDIRIRQLQQVFMVDMLSYGFLENHFHTVNRIRPDLAEKLSDWEVARRSLLLKSHSFSDSVKLVEPKRKAIERVLANPKKIKNWRARLSDLSWYMRYLKEPIARRANKEDGVTGFFWDARYKSVRLLDEIAVMLCSIYVDLNEVRAKMATTPEKSTFCSISQRIKSWQEKRRKQSQSTGKQAWDKPSKSRLEPAPNWLSPINALCDNGTKSGTLTEEKPFPNGARPSNSGFLPMKVEQYFQLCDWIGRIVRKGKRGAIPAGLAPILERLTDNVDLFVQVANNFGSLFKRCFGSPEAIREHRTRQNAKKIHGLSLARSLYPASA